MTVDTQFDAAITDEETFESVLGQLLLAANRNSVDVRGALKFEHDDGIPTWEVMITRVKDDASA